MSKACPTNIGLQTQTLARQPLTLTRYSAAPVLIRLASAPLWFCVAIGFCFGFVKRRANRILGWVIDASMYVVLGTGEAELITWLYCIRND